MALHVMIPKEAQLWATRVALEMRRVSVGDGRATSFRQTVGDEEENHIIGAIGEIGWCIHHNVEWPARIGAFKGADVGKHVQIRTRTETWHELRVKPGDNSDHAWFHVIHVANNMVELRGWLWGWEAKKFPQKNPRGFGWVHFVPNENLRPIDTLPSTIIEECPAPFTIPQTQLDLTIKEEIERKAQQRRDSNLLFDL